MSNWKNYFSFSATERRGTLLLTFILFSLIIVSMIDFSSESNLSSIDFQSFDKEVNTFYASKDSIRKSLYKKKDYRKSDLKLYSNHSKFKKEDKISPKKNDFVVEINSASAIDFQKVKGIGEVLSERIIKFRSALKGFYSISQLSDVYGIESSLIEKNRNHFQINKSKIRYWSINETEFKELLKHPYLDYDAVKCIFGFRNKSDSVLVSQALTCVSDSLKLKLKPYLRE